MSSSHCCTTTSDFIALYIGRSFQRKCQLDLVAYQAGLLCRKPNFKFPVAIRRILGARTAKQKVARNHTRSSLSPTCFPPPLSVRRALEHSVDHFTLEVQIHNSQSLSTPEYVMVPAPSSGQIDLLLAFHSTFHFSTS